MRSSMDKLCNMSNVTQIHTLSEHPTVSCGLCGAKAHDPGNVCDPVQLPDIGHVGD